MRLERTQDYYYQYNDGYSSYTSEGTNYKIRFYSDAAGTIPIPLPSNIPINYHYETWWSGTYGGSSSSHNGTFNALAGTFEYEIGNTVLYSENSTPEEYYVEQTSYTLLPGANYTIIN